jgi:hypothetical protein
MIRRTIRRLSGLGLTRDGYSSVFEENGKYYGIVPPTNGTVELTYDQYMANWSDLPASSFYKDPSKCYDATDHEIPCGQPQTTILPTNFIPIAPAPATTTPQPALPPSSGPVAPCYELIGGVPVPCGSVPSSTVTSGGQTYTTPVYTTPAPSSTAVSTSSSAGLLKPIVSFSGGDGSTLHPGDSWKITITGAAPNAGIVVNYTKNGQPAGSAQIGATDANGNWSLSGTFSDAELGTWREAWTVGSVSIGSYGFSVVSSAPSSSSPSSESSPSSSSSSSGQEIVGTPGGGTGSDIFSALPGSLQPIANDIIKGAAAKVPTWGWIAIAAAVFFFLQSQGKRR